jgi:hypothetical protein
MNKIDRQIRALTQAGLLLLVALMPWHAFLSVWLGSVLGHQALIQSWKEALVVALGVGAAWLAFRDRTALKRLKSPVIYLVIGFTAVALATTVAMRPGWSAALFGIKTDLEFLAVFVISWFMGEPALTARLVKTILASSVLAAAAAVALGLWLPANFLAHFGYSAATIAPYQMIDPAISTIRTPGTFGGPNQLGAFMILPLALLLALALRARRWWHWPALLAVAGALAVSYSRSAWIGAAVTVVAVIVATLPLRRTLLAVGGFLAGIGAALGIGVALSPSIQYYLLHATAGTVDTTNSTAQHAVALRQGLELSAAHPFGLGLGAAGPASFHSAAAVIPENYYLQIAIETGWAGAALFVALTAALAWRLWRVRASAYAAGTLAALLGVSVVNLFLHGWADSSLALTFWALAGSIIGENQRA